MESDGASKQEVHGVSNNATRLIAQVEVDI